jgi:hypothetical protein
MCSLGACSGLLGLAVGPASGQSLTPLGREYPIGASPRGDQMHSAVGLTASGGHLVWQDSILDAQGQGIGTLRLGSDLAGFGGIRRVNPTPQGDQVLPQVALLPDGGAAFVWVTSRGSLPGVYGRIRSAAGSFATDEFKVNRGSFSTTTVVMTNWPAYQNGVLATRPFAVTNIATETRGGFRDARVAVLSDGTVVFAYSCFRKSWNTTRQLVEQTSTVKGKQVLNSVLQPTTAYLDAMQDIFLCPFSSAGVKLRRDAPVNEFVPFNQREPAVAALSNGNLVVVWVSEQQVPNSASQPALVDIKARVFDSLCRPLGPEFRVNPVRGWCGEPAVSALGAASFTVVWSQYDLAGNGGWDVYGRVVNAANPAALEAATAAFRINEFTRGRQSVPQIATLGVNQMVVWTSAGQDGSDDGVFGRLLSRGELAGAELQVNNRVINKQVQPGVAADGANRFLVVWSSIVSGWTGFDLMGRAFQSEQPPAPLAAPTVAALGLDALSVSWAAPPYPSVARYEVFMDGAATPVVVSNTWWVASGLQPRSTHSFRVAYVLADGQRADPSPAGTGSTGAEVGSPNPPVVGSNVVSGGEPIDVGGGGEGPLRVDLRVTAVGRRLYWNTQAGGVYQVQSSRNLVSWSNVEGTRVAASASDSLDLTNQQAAAFFRVVRVK